MRFRTSALSALLAASAVGLGVSPAYADATGTGTITFEGNTCNFTFTYAGGPPPATVTVESIDIEDSCAADGTGSGSVTFGPGDAATLSLTVAVNRPLSCGYSGSLKGTYAGTAATFPAQDVPKTSGSIFCPNPANIAITANL